MLKCDKIGSFICFENYVSFWHGLQACYWVNIDTCTSYVWKYIRFDFIDNMSE